MSTHLAHFPVDGAGELGWEFRYGMMYSEMRRTTCTYSIGQRSARAWLHCHRGRARICWLGL